VPGAWLRSAIAVHLPALLVRSHERLVAALRDARPDLLITLDSPWYDRHDPTGLAHIGLLRDVDVVLPSEEDLALAFPRMPVLDAAHALRGLGARTVVVKLAAAGSLVVDDNGVTHVPAFPSHVVDPTGAGDSFCGGFLAGLRETRDPVRAAQFGTASASFVVEHAEALAVRAVDRRAAEQRLAAIADRVVQGVTRDPREMAA
jgi:sugar/nucleoside kinase (ribokinase family)